MFCRRCWYHARPFLSPCLSDVYIYLLVRFLPGQNDLEQSLLSVRTHWLPAHAHGRQQILVSLHFSGPKYFCTLSSHLKICITQQNINPRVIYFNINKKNIVLMQVIRWTPKPQEEERPCTAVELHFVENSGQLMYLDLA